MVCCLISFFNCKYMLQTTTPRALPNLALPQNRVVEKAVPVWIRRGTVPDFYNPDAYNIIEF
jgi:hypothetical protein